MSLRSNKLASVPRASSLDRDGGLIRDMAITQSASTVTGHLGSSGSSSSHSEAEPSDECLVQRLSSEAMCPCASGAVTPLPAPPLAAVATPTRAGRATPRGASPSPRCSSMPPCGGGAGAEEVKVVVRVRPPLEKDRPLSYFAVESDQTKLISTPAEGLTPQGRTMSVEEFGFSRVIAPAENNSQTFEALGLRELIAGVGRGYQETIFAYGQTGSGKTHTILGSRGVDLLSEHERVESQGEHGLLQLCTKELFANVFSGSGDKALRKYIQIICLEIKNEEIIDLLPVIAVSGPASEPSASSSPRQAPESAANRLGSVHVTEETLCVKGKRSTYRKATTWSYEETMWLLRKAVASREVGSSSLNSESSRSHMVIRFFVKSFEAPDSIAKPSPVSGATPRAVDGTGVMGSLTLVDLAGNERENPLDNVNRKSDTKAINVSLTHLNRMLLKMQSGQLDESDRRQGTLNMVLYESLREDCGATMIFCIHPDRRFALSARSTLQMALRCRRIVRKKQVRRLEAAGYNTELVDLRMEASALTHAHQQALEARLRKEEELQRTAQLLQDLRHRYEVKSRYLENLRSKLENKNDHINEEDYEKQQLVYDLERKDELMQSMLQQLRELEHQIIEKDGTDELTEKEKEKQQALVERRPSGKTLDGEGFEDFRQELEKVHRDELRAVKESYEKELRHLKESIRHRENAQALDASPADSSAGEPCSEPSMSSRAGGFGDDEASCTQLQETLDSALGPSPVDARGALALGALPGRPPRISSSKVVIASRRSVEQAASPQHHGARARADSGDMDRPPSSSGSRKSSRWRHADALSTGPSTPRGDGAASTPRGDSAACESKEIKTAPSKTERVLGHLQNALGADGSEALEAAETYLAQLCRLASQARIESRHRAQSVDMAFKAARRHGSSLNIRRDVAKLMSEISSKDATMKEEMVAKGALRLTIDTLHFLLSLFPSTGIMRHEASSDVAADACSACFRLLAAFCQRNRGHQASARAALEAVLNCLAVPELRCDSESLVNGCYVILALMDKEHQELVRSKDGIMLLLQLLDEEVIALENETVRRPLDATFVVEQASATLCYYIAGCLAKIVQENKKNQQALYEVGGIDLLLRTLRTCLQSGRVVGNACVALAHASRRHEPSQHAARSQGAVHLILGALLAYRGESSVQMGVCRAVATLTERNTANQQEFLTVRLPDGDGETSAVALLIEALNSKPEEEPFFVTTCWALTNLITGNADAMESVRLLRGLEVVISLLERFVKEERACEYLCRLLTELSSGGTFAAQRNRQELRALGAADAVTAMAQHHARSEGYVLVRAREALQNLNVQERYFTEGRDP